MISNLKILRILMILVCCGSCGFFSDNTQPSNVLKINSQQSDNSCANLTTVWTNLSKNKYSDEKKKIVKLLNETLLCHIDAFEDKVKAIKSPRPEGVSPKEFVLIAKNFFLKDRPLSEEEVSVLFFLKSLVTKKSELSFQKDEFNIIRKFFLENGETLINYIDYNYFEVLRILVLEGPYPENFSLRSSHLVGVAQIAERLVVGLDLTQVKSKLAGLIPRINPFFGYSSKMDRLPIGELLNKIPEVLSASEELEELVDKSSSSKNLNSVIRNIGNANKKL